MGTLGSDPPLAGQVLLKELWTGQWVGDFQGVDLWSGVFQLGLGCSAVLPELPTCV